ncbi:MAG TPA: hypothetical protein VFD83_00490 [Candidatus Polarisedimenticolia bacterium]|nr:hypothetical protein [Candidatus Polarisedimenticolia bacterium]
MIQTWIAAILTLCVFSFLYKENPFYRFAEHLFVGAAAGYLLAVQWQNVLIPNVWSPLTAKGDLVVLIPLVLGLMMLARVWEKGSGIARWSIAFYVGIYSGVAMPGYMQAQIFAQLADAAKPWPAGWAGVNAALILLGLLTCIAYFFFSLPHRGVQGVGARIGIYFLMVAFGASFGYTVMARVSLLIARVQFLLRDWLHILPS